MSNPPAADAEAENVSAPPAALRLSDASTIANARLEVDGGSLKDALSEIAPAEGARSPAAASTAGDPAASPETAEVSQQTGDPAHQPQSNPLPDKSANDETGAGAQSPAAAPEADRNGFSIALPVADETLAVEAAARDPGEDEPADAGEHAGANGASAFNGAANGHHGPIARLIETSEIGPVSARQPPISPALSASVSPILSALDEAERVESDMVSIAHGAQAEMELAAPDALPAALPEPAEPDVADTAAAQDADASAPLEESVADPGLPAEAAALELPQALAADMEAGDTVFEDAATPSAPEAPPAPASSQADTPEPEPASEPQVEQEPQAAQSPAVSGAFDAASRLVAEANAAAEALENLKRLLERRMPGLALPAAPAGTRLRSALREPEEESLTAPPPPLPLYPVRSSDGNLPALRPAQPKFEAPAPYVPERRRPDVRGFMAGFALSWAIGAALFIYLTAG
jgi:hypothetical protein